MVFRSATDARPVQFDIVRHSFQQSGGNPFADVLPEQDIQEAFQHAGVEFGTDAEDIYTPAIVLWGFLSQMLFKGEQRSCAAAIKRIVHLCVAIYRTPPGGNTAAYCRARQKLQPEPIIRLVQLVAQRGEEAAEDDWRCAGRGVTMADGTTMSMPDTAANQAEWPQPTSQKPGLGFPIVRMVVLISLATGMIHDMAMGRYAGKQTGEAALLRELMSRIPEDEILLCDRYYCTYFTTAALLADGRDLVSKLHHARKDVNEEQRDTFQAADTNEIKRQGKGDSVVTWKRPPRPEWMSVDDYEKSPETIQVRYVTVPVVVPGFRTKKLTIATTLLDPKEFLVAEIAALYRQRWIVELDIRAIKISMDLDVLRCKTPHMIKNEIWTGLLAYNLVRAKQAAAAYRHELNPRMLSFTDALQTIAAGWTMCFPLTSAQQKLVQDIWEDHSAARRVGNRPDRVEPRKRKRRPKNHKNLTVPRREAKAQLLAAT